MIILVEKPKELEQVFFSDLSVKLAGPSRDVTFCFHPCLDLQSPSNSRISLIQKALRTRYGSSIVKIIPIRAKRSVPTKNFRIQFVFQLERN